MVEGVEMIFSGPTRDPAVITVPGNVAPGVAIINRLNWGEDIDFQIPDPGFDCSIKFVIGDTVDRGTPLITLEYERESDEGVIELSVSGPDSIKYLYPGVFYFQSVYALPDDSYKMGNQGSFELAEVVGGSVIPSSV